ncbi:MAG: AMP-binding protein [Parvibaculaceae bacterium]
MSASEAARPRHFAELVKRQCEIHPELPVLTFVDIDTFGQFQSEIRTFPDLLKNAERLAVWLRNAGVGRSDRFGLMLQNHPEFVEATIAAAMLGATFVPIDPRSVGSKLSYMLGFVEAKAVIAGDYAVDAIMAVADEIPALRNVLVVGSGAVARSAGRVKLKTSHEVLSAPVPSGLEHQEVDPDAPMFMMFTSGTTSMPKAVVRTHRAHMKGLKGLRALGVTPDDVLYTGLPLSHINAQSTLGMALAMPQRAVISRRFTKSRLWDVCREHGCTVFTLLGGMIPEIYSVEGTPRDAENPVRLIIASGMPEKLWDQYRRRFDVTITEVYGSTEAGGVLINREGEGPAGSMGKPPKTMEAAILDEYGRPCPPGIIGELCFRPMEGAPAPVTYFKNRSASEEKVAGGWFRTGDMARTDKDGWFYFCHRKGGGVRRNGDFVNTTLVETVLASCPYVNDVFVYGVEGPDNVAGEKMLVAAIVLAGDGSIEQVADWASGRMQKNEQPEIWQELSSIPKTVSEKPIERECIALLREHGLVPENA